MGVAQATTLYRLPLASNPGYSAWFDHDSSADMLRYDGNTSVPYDGHKGTDFVATTGTSVYAGASGSLYYRYDGCYDKGNPLWSSSCGDGGYGNHVRIEHLDGHVTMYAHMEIGTPVWYQSILCGGYVGQFGASGYVTGPHLHFEMWPSATYGSFIDFFGGNYSNGGFSYWKNQNGGWPTTQCQ